MTTNSTQTNFENFEEPDQLPKTNLDTPTEYYTEIYFDKVKKFIPEDLSVDEYDKKPTKAEEKKVGLYVKKESDHNDNKDDIEQLEKKEEKQKKRKKA